MVVSGAPEKEDNHAEKVCDMALDMVDAITDLKDPSTGKSSSPDNITVPYRHYFRIPAISPSYFKDRSLSNEHSDRNRKCTYVIQCKRFLE